MPDEPNLIEHKELQRLLNSFVIATGMGVTMLDADGTRAWTPKSYENLCPFCAKVRGCEAGEARCLASMSQAGRFAAQLGEPYIYRCHAGLVEIASPIVVEETYIGSVSCGPVLMWDWDEMAVRELLERTADLPIHPETLLVASRSIREFSGGAVQAAADMMFVMVNYIARTGVATLALRREINAQQAQIALAIEEGKRRETALGWLERGGAAAYPLHMERELLGKVRLGDRAGARAILNEWLAVMFVQSAADMERLKARMLELVVVLSRAAVEGGASLERMLGMNYTLLGELGQAKEFDRVCAWIVRVLDSFMDEVYETRNVKNAGLLKLALAYIRENYGSGLTLEHVAKHIHISPYYLAHMLKEELDITFVEYLTKVRVEEARTLLEQGVLSVTEVAARVGYEDSGYFSKVFKRATGVTPASYRREAKKGR